MQRCFTHYWDNATWAEEQAHGDEGQTLGTFYGSQFGQHGLQPGDVVYALTVLHGDIYLHCRVEVEHVDQHGDPEGRWREAVKVRPGTSTPRHFANRVPREATRLLTFISTQGVKALRLGDDGTVDPMSFRQMRELTVESAALLDVVLDDYEGASLERDADHVAATNSANDVRAWMFQFNPRDYDLDAQLRARELFEDWRAKQHPDSMRIGERVYFLRSGGSDHAALVAAGRLVSLAHERHNLPEGKYPCRVDVLYEFRIEPALTRQEMRQDAILSTFRPFATGHYNTNFMLPPAIAARTHELVKDRLYPLTPEVEEITSAGHNLIDGTLDARTRTLASVVRRQGQPEFRKRLLEAYERRCAVTDCNAECVLEAAHITPYLGPHTNLPANGLLLRADIHTLFDLGMLAVDTVTMTVVLHPDLGLSEYARFAGRPLRPPTNTAYAPSREALDRHRRSAYL